MYNMSNYNDNRTSKTKVNRYKKNRVEKHKPFPHWLMILNVIYNSSIIIIIINYIVITTINPIKLLSFSIAQKIIMEQYFKESFN